MRPPKANVDDELHAAMKFHVLGVIFHARPDRPHLFAVPHPKLIYKYRDIE